MPRDAPGASAPIRHADGHVDRSGSEPARAATAVSLDSETMRVQRRSWRWALAFFVIAAATGAWMRFGLAFGWTPHLRFDDVRHAHSHLMFFGWVTPPLFVGIAAVAGRTGVRMRGFGWVLAGTFAAAAASYPAFLASGYRLTPLFGRELPLSMAAAGLSGMAWIAFVALYVRARSQMHARSAAPHALSLAWLDAAVFLLAASLLGIAGLAAGGMLGTADPHLTGGLVDYFLALFGEGWFGAAVLGLAHAAAMDDRDAGERAGAGWHAWPALAFLAGTLVWTAAELGLAFAARPTAAAWLAGAEGIRLMNVLAALGHLAGGAALVAACSRLLRSSRLRESAAGVWLPALGFLAAKGVVELALVSPALREAAGSGGLRVLLLHGFLLGAVSLALVASKVSGRSPAPSRAALGWSWAFVGAVLLLLAGLAPLAGLTPWLPPGGWVQPVAAVTSLGPLVAAIGLWAVAPGGADVD